MSDSEYEVGAVRDFPPAGSLSINQMRERDGLISPDALQSATYSLMLVFRGFTIEPEVITQTVGVEPTRYWSKGDPWHGLNGKLAMTPRHESAWILTAPCFDRREDDPDVWDEMNDALGPRLNDRLQEFLEPFLRESSLVNQLVAESDVACIVMHLPGQFHFGFEIEPATLSSVAKLGLQFGIEVFPDAIID